MGDNYKGKAAEGKAGDRFRQGILGRIHHPALIIEEYGISLRPTGQNKGIAFFT